MFNDLNAEPFQSCHYEPEANSNPISKIKVGAISVLDSDGAEASMILKLKVCVISVFDSNDAGSKKSRCVQYLC